MTSRFNNHRTLLAQREHDAGVAYDCNEKPEFTVGQVTPLGPIMAVKIWGDIVIVTVGGQTIIQRLLKLKLAALPKRMTTYSETEFPQPQPTHGFVPLSVAQCRDYATAFFAPKSAPKPQMVIEPPVHHRTLTEILNSPYAQQYADGVDALIERQNAALEARYRERLAAIKPIERPAFLLPPGV